MLKASLFDCSDAHILLKKTISITAQVRDNPNNGDREVVYKYCAPFTDCISEIDNTHLDNAKDIDIVMPIYNKIEYSGNYSKTSGRLWQDYLDEPALTNAIPVANFRAANNSTLFKFKQKITGKKDAAKGRKDVEIMVPLKYLSNFLENSWNVFN